MNDVQILKKQLLETEDILAGSVADTVLLEGVKRELARRLKEATDEIASLKTGKQEIAGMLELACARIERDEDVFLELGMSNVVWRKGKWMEHFKGLVKNGK